VNRIEFKFDIEKIVLLLFFAFMMYYGSAQINDYRINIDYPRGFRAQDAFWHPSIERHIMEVGSYKYNPPYIVLGYNDTVGAYPPLRPYTIAMFSFLTGIEPYNIMIFTLVLLTTFSALIMYLMIKDFNKHVALFSLVLMPFLFYKNFYVAFTWGQFGFVVGSFFLISIAWALTKLELKNSWLLLGLFLAGAALSHTPELVIVMGLILFYFFIKLVYRQLKFNEIKSVIMASGVAGILSIYYLIIFKNTWMVKFASAIKFEAVTQVGFLYGKLIDFGWLLPFLILGCIFAIILIVFQKKLHVALIAGFYMIIFAYSNYAIENTAVSAFQTRLMYPLYLSLFFGLGLYHILKFIIKNMSLQVSAIISILLMVLLVFTVYEKNNPSGMMDPYLWNAFNWIRASTPKDAKIYFFYGDRYQQSAILFTTERMAWKVDPQDYLSALQNQTVKRAYLSYANRFLYYVRKGLFRFEEREDPGRETDIDICNFDYYVFDKVGQYTPLIQYNIFIESMFLNLGWMKKVYDSPLLDIVKNDKSGVDCVALQNRTQE
jgi:hypothetical protein